MGVSVSSLQIIVFYQVSHVENLWFTIAKLTKFSQCGFLEEKIYYYSNILYGFS